MTREPDRQLLRKRLRAVSYFQGLDVAALDALAQAAIWRTYAPGAVIFLEGEASANLYFLAEGWIKVVKTSPEGREQVLRFLGPGEIFNEVGVLAHRPNPATAIALEHSKLWLLPRDSVRAMLLERPEAMLQVVENMADRLVEMVGLVTDLSLRSVEARLARLLLESSDETGVMPRRRWSTQAELAARLGTVPDVLSRALRRLVDAGIVHVERRQIRILDRERLKERAQLAN
ncbi:MAG: Crp/Fnr family transcriptional regulator [Chloroflexi bacterium]|nr:Crp/Fnr family transcriptional regulator [Chloroflexota bacterium]